MKRVIEKPVLPNQIEAGPQYRFLGWLIVALSAIFAEFGRRINQLVPKDGSELIQMTAYDSTTFNMAADVDDADVGFYTIVKVVLSGADRTMTGIANGSGYEGDGGRVVTLINASLSNLTLTLTHNDNASDAENRFYLPRQLSVAVGRDMAMTFWYDPAVSKWRLMR